VFPAFTRPVRIVVVVVALAVLAACGGGGSGSAGAIPAPPQSLGITFDQTVPAAIRNLPLTMANGKTTTLAAYQGRPVMISDFLTLCTDICPMISANSAAIARALAANGLSDKTAVLEISVDPHRDTAARLRAYQKLYGGALPNWTLLRASPANTAKLWKFFGVEYRRTKEDKPASIDWLTHKPLTYDVEHSDDLIFLGANGDERFVVNGGPDTQGKLPPSRLVQFLDGEGIKNLYHPNTVEDWTVDQGLQVFSWLTNRHLTDPT
jgi:cytochrome oxidase Cu insertion factor (SCO1/SenC/PrrC family)